MAAKFLEKEFNQRLMDLCAKRRFPARIREHRKKIAMATMVAEIFTERDRCIDTYEVGKIVRMKLELDHLLCEWARGMLYRHEAVVTGIDTQMLMDRDLSDLIKTADTVLKKAVEMLEADGSDRTGGYMTVISKDFWPLAFRVPFGVIPLDKASKYSELSLEKACRLLEYEWHLTSFKTRDPEAYIVTMDGRIEKWGMWGGAVRTLKEILSFSGLPELWDEACMFVTAIKTGRLDKARTLRRISRKRNPVLRPLLEAVGCNIQNERTDRR